jgi:hypothetical protein
VPPNAHVTRTEFSLGPITKGRTRSIYSR